MKVTAIIFSLIPGYRVAIYKLPQLGEIWIREFAGRSYMMANLMDIGIINRQEHHELIDHDFTYSFASEPVEIDLNDILTSGFLPYIKPVIQ